MHLFGYRKNRFLNYVLRLWVIQAGLHGDSIDQFPIGVKELLPTLLIVPVLQTGQDAAAGGNQFVLVHQHDANYFLFKSQIETQFFQLCGVKMDVNLKTSGPKHRTSTSLATPARIWVT